MIGGPPKYFLATSQDAAPLARKADETMNVTKSLHLRSQVRHQHVIVCILQMLQLSLIV